MSELRTDLEGLPLAVQQSARLTTGDREVMWRRVDVGAAIEALAGAGKVVLGLDVRRYLSETRFQEAAWSAYDRTGGDDVEAARSAALAALARLDGADDLDDYEWVLVTW